MASQSGITIAAVNLRTGPGTQHAVIVKLAPKTPVEISETQGDWHKAKANGQDGFLHKSLIQLSTQGVADGFLKEKAAPAPVPASGGGASGTKPAPVSNNPLENVPMEPAKKLPVNPKAQLLERLSATIWNKAGGLLTSLSNELGIDPGVAVAVLAVESGGNGFGPDGRMIIRFENQIFFDRWGKQHQEKYHQHFHFNPDKRWLEHQWRASPNDAWQEFHGKQSEEWKVLTFAAALDDTAAKSSISMGGPQIMGFNYAALGFESVQQMFDAFSASERQQLIGFFDFVQGPTPNSRRIIALQNKDFDTFASMYNGPGQAAKYGGLIRTSVDAFHKLQASNS